LTADHPAPAERARGPRSPRKDGYARPYDRLR
jgi:hypothetical protein